MSGKFRKILTSLAVFWTLGAAMTWAAQPGSIQVTEQDDAPGYPDAGGEGVVISTPAVPTAYVRGEYLFWAIQGESAPPLVTTSTAGTARADAGVLGLSTTSVLDGDQEINDDWQSGARIVAGYQFTPSTRIEGECFGLERGDTTYSASSDGSTILARPFFNLTTGAQDSLLVAYPAIFSGSVSVEATTTFLGCGIEAITDLSSSSGPEPPSDRIGVIYGFRFLHLNENLSISDSRTSLDPSAPVDVGTMFTSADSFSTVNNFYGANVGLTGEHHHGGWTTLFVGQVAVGSTAEQVRISGSSSATPPGGPTTDFSGGLLAMPTNIGTYRTSSFSIVPQLELKLAYDLTSNVRLSVGYDLIYWSNVARPGAQISTNVNTTQASGQPLVGLPGPIFGFAESSVWIQGVSAGAEIRF